MATLREYFIKSGEKDLTTTQNFALRDKSGTKLGEITARLHLDFEAHTKYISFYIPVVPSLECPEVFALSGIDEILKWPETNVAVQMRYGTETKDARELPFTGQVYLYSERPVTQELKDRLIKEAGKVGHRLTFRSVDYMELRNKSEKPLAFICHDSRDKAVIAEPLALELQKRMCLVWYDDFSLRVGDSLREGIERGLRECPKCVLILTPNFLSNGGWSKREYDSIFTREIVQRQKVILPIWHNISVENVFTYSPVLADRVALQWSLGKEEVARRIVQTINT